MFKGQKAKNDTPSDEVETIIGPSVKIEGDFKSNGNVMVAGFISGTFESAQNLRVEEHAKIVADIKAKEAIVAGEIKGNVEVEGHLEILSTAKIEGNIKTGSISIQQGAEINGNCSMAGADSVVAEIPETMEEEDQAETPKKESKKEEVTQDWLMAGEGEAESESN